VANLAALISALFVGIFAFFFSKKAKKAKAQEAQTLQDNLKKIDSALNDDSPADSLSDLGNARRRD
jgi:cbb3-type cytochrome oxidase subunit 3